MHDLDSLIRALLEGDAAASLSETKALHASGVGVERIVTEGVESAMRTLDGKCTLEQFNLLEIMLVGRAAMEAMKYLCPSGIPPTGIARTVLVATLEGDIHDLGKNILKMVLTGNGYRVVDCGKDCPVERLVEAARREMPVVVGVSGLITPVVPLVRRVRPLLNDSGLGRIKVMAGGAALKQSSASGLNVDYVAESAFDGARYVAGIVGESPE